MKRKLAIAYLLLLFLAAAGFLTWMCVVNPDLARFVEIVVGGATLGYLAVRALDQL